MNDPLSVRTVLVVGGGIGGMSAAIALRQAGIAVDLVEADAEWRALGAGLTLNSATLRAFDALGVLDDVSRDGDIHAGRRLLNGKGEVVAEVPAYKPEPGDLHAGGGILRPALHAILSRRVREVGVGVRLGMSVERLEHAEDATTAVLADGSTPHYDLVIGADGLMSHVRQSVFPEAPAPRFTGQGCWRAVFPRPAEVASTWVYVDPELKLGLNPISRDEMYMFILEHAPGNPWRDPAGWPEELRRRMTSVPGLPTELAKTIGPDSRINYRPLEALLVPPPWHRGRVVLLGDACHGATPHAGYGAGLAVEDAVALAANLAAPGSLDERLTGYATRRHDRAKKVLDASLALGELEMARAPGEEQMAASAALFALVREGAGVF